MAAPGTSREIPNTQLSWMPRFVVERKVDMATIIFATAIGGFVLLLAATITLVVLNWSEKTLAPVLSIALVGTATTLATVLLSLKESTLESAFATSVVLDTVQGGPPMVMPDPTNTKMTARLAELFRIGHPAVNRDGKTIVTVKMPTNAARNLDFVESCSNIDFSGSSRVFNAAVGP